MNGRIRGTSIAALVANLALNYGEDGATICTEMFGEESGTYWTDTLEGNTYVWFAHFHGGYVHYGGIYYGSYPVRCVRSTP